jgi:putative acetyltransferase
MLQQLRLDDMDQAAVVQRQSRDLALPWIAVLYTPEEDRWYFRERVFETCQLWGNFEGSQLIGFIAFRERWIDHLYILPSSQRRGIGTALLQVAQDQKQELSLWTFQRNLAARRFYERHGFLLIDETDGARNEEKEPDALYRWRST